MAIMQIRLPKGFDVLGGKLNIRTDLIENAKEFRKKAGQLGSSLDIKDLKFISNSKLVPGWLEAFCGDETFSKKITFNQAKEIIYGCQHLIGRDDEKQFYALVNWNSNAFDEFYAVYESPTFCLATYTDKGFLKKHSNSAEFAIHFDRAEVHYNLGKEFNVYLKPGTIHFNPKLIESQNYSRRISGGDLSEAIRSILR